MIDNYLKELSNNSLEASALYQSAVKQLEMAVQRFCVCREEKPRTRGVPSRAVNHQLIEYLNRIVRSKKYRQQIDKLQQLNNHLFAFQYAYQAVVDEQKGPPRKSTWRADIEAKIGVELLRQTTSSS